MATRVRDWATVDFYALLGVDPSADAATVTRAYRELAKASHPDTAADPGAAAEFPDIAAAYAVLGDRGLRREYDRVRAGVRPPAPRAGTPANVPSVAGKAPRHWSRRRALVVLLSGVLVTLLGVGAAVLTWTM